MSIKKSFGIAVKISRNAKKITQEDFSETSSRTYISTLERGLYSPTVEKCVFLVKKPPKTASKRPYITGAKKPHIITKNSQSV
jgi:transcriptional regulator with XRE-family HTH domain